MKMNLMNQVQRRNAGYTIDQTILIVAVIAILITLIIASVGWDILNRTSGTKMASLFRQLEDSNGQFFATTGMWPQTATELPGDDTLNVAVLANNAAGIAAVNAAGNTDVVDRMKNFLPGLEDNGGVIEHAFGGGGALSQGEDDAVCPGAETYLVVTAANVPLTEITEADEAIDRGDGEATGRLRWDAAAAGARSVTYCANLIR